MEETKQKKKFPLQFKFGIRKEMITNLIMIVVMIGLMIVLMPAIGTNNALVTSMCLIAVLMTLKNDYSELQPIKNTILFFVVQVGLGALAFVANLHSVAMVLVTLGVEFLIVYIFTSDEKQSIYLPFLLNFVMMLYYPVTGIDLVIRLSILGGSALLIMLLQMLLNRNKFRKKIVKKINESIELMKQQVNAIAVGEDIDKIKERGRGDLQILGRNQQHYGCSVISNEKMAGRPVLFKNCSDLKQINRILTESYTQGDSQLDEVTYQALKDLLEAISLYENKQTDRESLREKLYGFYQQIGNNYVSYELKQE